MMTQGARILPPMWETIIDFLVPISSYLAILGVWGGELVVDKCSPDHNQSLTHSILKRTWYNRCVIDIVSIFPPSHSPLQHTLHCCLCGCYFFSEDSTSLKAGNVLKADCLLHWSTCYVTGTQITYIPGTYKCQILWLGHKMTKELLLFSGGVRQKQRHV